MKLPSSQTLLTAAFLAVPGIGRASFKKINCLCQHLKISLDDFYHQPNSQLWQLAGLNSAQCTALKKFQQRFTPEEYFGWLADQKIELIGIDDKRYPKLLKNIDDKPLILFKKGGDLDLNQRPIGVVGTRKISGYGRSVLAKFIPFLVAENATIVSGFMYGVDTLAHQLTLAHQGQTVAILGYGFDHLYPASQRDFFKEMLLQGQTFLTEYPPWVGAHRGNFPERNRIVAGMTLATVVIEAGDKSGSLITARLAGEYGRGICAVPGPITSAFSEGTKELINQGARLVSSPLEILEEAGLYQLGSYQQLTHPANQPVKQLNFDDVIQQQIFTILLNQPLSADELAQELKTPISQLNTALSLMEIGGQVRRVGESWYAQQSDSVQ